ncbi:MAG: hypothetical protein HY786_08515 [Deltaproteobacteria bacterium]|nr:hypothetical protein [Deltaproteobacteria bacterium]
MGIRVFTILSRYRTVFQFVPYHAYGIAPDSPDAGLSPSSFTAVTT